MNGRAVILTGGSRAGQSRFVLASNRIQFPDGEQYKITDQTDERGRYIALADIPATIKR